MKSTELKKRDAAKLFESGMSVTEAATKLGVGRSTVYQWHQAWRRSASGVAPSATEKATPSTSLVGSPSSTLLVKLAELAFANGLAELEVGVRQLRAISGMLAGKLPVSEPGDIEADDEAAVHLAALNGSSMEEVAEA